MEFNLEQSAGDDSGMPSVVVAMEHGNLKPDELPIRARTYANGFSMPKSRNRIRASGEP